MSSGFMLENTLREAILARPDAVLEDQDLMQALVAANERAMGENIVDLRGIAMERLEARLDRLEDTHRSVIAAAYENLSGTNLIQRAVLRLLEPTDFNAFLRLLAREMPEALNVDTLRLVLESHAPAAAPGAQATDGVLRMMPAGFVAQYIRDESPRTVLLRQLPDAESAVYGSAADWINSEACLRLDLGLGRLPGLLVLGAEDAHKFSPQQGTDLLTFFGGVFERVMRRWLA